MSSARSKNILHGSQEGRRGPRTQAQALSLLRSGMKKSDRHAKAARRSLCEIWLVVEGREVVVVFIARLGTAPK